MAELNGAPATLNTMAEEVVVQNDCEYNVTSPAPPADQNLQINLDGDGGSLSAPQELLIHSRKKQLRLQQLEETMRLREEYLREKFRILNAEDADEEIEGSCVIGPTKMCGTNVSGNTAFSPTPVQPVQNNRTNICPAREVPVHTVMQSPRQPSTRTAAERSQALHVDCNGNSPNIFTTFTAPTSTARSPNQVFASQSAETCNLTTSQFAARQCVPKDLPVFSGDPQEWHIFVSAYEQSTQMAGYSHHENLVRLQKCLRGKAREVVRNLLVLPEMVPDIINTLRMYFGRPEQILRVLIDRARQLPSPKGKLDLLIDFAFAIKNIVAIIHASKLSGYLNSPLLLQEFVEKLSQESKLNWAIYSTGMNNPCLEDFSTWLSTLAEAACRVTNPASLSEKLNKREAHLHTHKSDAVLKQYEEAKSMPRCAVCNNPHKVPQCDRFKALTMNERWDFVKRKNLCRQCLGTHSRRCWSNKSCGVDSCTIRHHRLLHSDVNKNSEVSTMLNNHRSISSNNTTYFRILPIVLYGRNKTISTYAFMDDGSTLTLIDQTLADELGEAGVPDPLCIHWTGDINRYEADSQRLDLRISGNIQGAKIYPLRGVYTVSSLNMSSSTLIADQLKTKYAHLKGIPLPNFIDIVPKLIIGVNNPNLIMAQKIREGGWQDPVGAKTRLGWTIFGGGNNQSKGNGLNLHKCDCESDNNLHELVKSFMLNENIGISVPKVNPVSMEDQRAIEILGNCELHEGQYTASLLWSNDNVRLPDSLPTALSRFKCLERKLSSNPELQRNMQEQIDNLVKKNYATKLPNEAINDRGDKIWYLPVFIVRNPHKPNKIRLVWDAAAKSRDISLNNFLLKGPDMLTPLVNILFNFRMGRIAICGDIEEMFHRIKLRHPDADAQRFLWRTNMNDPINVYRLNVLSFGASCSPCIAHYVRNLNASVHAAQNSQVACAIKNHHYVDDFIDSARTVDEAIKLAKNVRDVHSKCGFNMRNWSSNSPDVLAALNGDGEPQLKSFDCSKDVINFEKILGMYWEPKSDTFSYVLKFVRLKRNVFADRVVPTKREVLQVLMSVFDPLGLVACLTSYLKILIQDIWRSGIDWDQPLNYELSLKWKTWIEYIPVITSVSVPRCYSPLLYEDDCKVQLHTFVDASENAYAAVSYFRIEAGGHVVSRLVAAKAKVAPLRPLSIPRLELQAAVIGARLTNMVEEAHHIKFEKRCIWSDSKTVLKWLHGDPRKFQQFVMFRIAEIQEATAISEWRWIPTKMNVADIATKTRPCIEVAHQWINGPAFLTLPTKEWPEQEDLGTVNPSEFRTKLLIHNVRKVNINFEYFSNWLRLYRAIANCVLYIEKLKQRLQITSEGSHLTACHFRRAKLFIFKTIQMEHFDDWSLLKVGKPVCKTGPLRNLQVYMDDEHLIRVKNRATYFQSCDQPQRDFIVLPPGHRVTYLIVDHYHQRFYHIQHETALNEVRQLFFIPKLRSLFKAVRRNCQVCKIANAAPQAPQMAQLPTARLAAYSRPFTYVGIDYFGPILVTENRKAKKRWGVLLTCLTIRAIHIEIAHSLSTDSCLMCLRNFIARRGCPVEIYSDNGTNFRGADSFLKDELLKLNASIVERELAHKGIAWKFNPPAAPHMGGAWERLIRTTKAVLHKISPSQRFSDESLRSALLEVEMIINSRPLAYLSLDYEDQEPITPNHFLLGSSNGAKPFCKPEEISLKMNLRQSEMFANLFWRRWVREMIPSLTRRSKWFEKVKPISEGDIVLIVDENAERNTWLKGIVVETTMAKDGQVRRAKVKTRQGVLERPAVKLAVLDIGKDKASSEDSSAYRGDIVADLSNP
ncbi:uncharacterized protein LOC128870597 [Anastrepha ludens]|uniref:uncharacterized protein LOC128870597 n=1 Tax=Anastrepha ludens TaxID=28586 RepID=UPI0023AFFB76|nr:uncharacterized protein LOC128870597 [Anastrepha ludens]